MKRLILLILTLLLYSNAQASTWLRFAEAPNTVYDYEPRLITKLDNGGKVLIVWTRATTLAQVTMTRYELHCASRSFRIIVESKLQGQHTYQSWDNQDRWKYAVPDSIEMALIDITCPYWQ